MTRFVDERARLGVMRHLLALTTYAGIFCALLLPKLLPVHHGRILSNSPADGAIFLWSLGWWPHAIGQGHLVPYTHVLFAPHGTNLAWTTSMPTAGVLLAPVTLGFGVFVAFNVLSVLAPITAGFATYALVHRLTGTWGPSFVAGLLFALSPLERTEVAIGHLNLTLTALVPVAAYLVARLLDRSMGRVVFVVAFAVACAAQLGISTEVFFTASALGWLALILWYAWDPERRPALRRCALLLVLGYLGAAALAGPLLYATLALPHPAGLLSSGGALLPFSGVESHIHPSPGTLALMAFAAAAWLGLLVYLVATRRRGPAVRALGVAALVALACAPGILVVGRTTVPTPWTLIRHLPLAGLVRPQRLTMFAWLIGAVALGTWVAAASRSWPRRAVAVATLSALLPAMWLGSWTSTIPPSPFSHGHPGRGENVAVVAGPPPPARRYEDLAFPTVWQAGSSFSFRLADAYVGSFPPSLPAPVRRFVFGHPPAPRHEAVVSDWLRREHVSAVLLMRPTAATLGPIHRLLRTNPVLLRGAALFPVRRTGHS